MMNIQNKTNAKIKILDEVVDLGRVFNALQNGDYSDLEKISDETDNVDQSMFGEYLEIGLSGWIKCIKNLGLTQSQNCDGVGISNTDAQHRLKNTLKWLIREEEVAGILKGHDDTSKVIKQLVLSFKK